MERLCTQLSLYRYSILWSQCYSGCVFSASLCHLQLSVPGHEGGQSRSLLLHHVSSTHYTIHTNNVSLNIRHVILYTLIPAIK